MNWSRGIVPAHHASLALMALAVSHCSGQCTPQWLAISSPESFFSPAYAVTTWDPDGLGPKPALLVIGGAFSQAGSTSAQRVVAWNGAEWVPLGLGINGGGTVRALVDFNGLLIAAGQFAIAGGVPATNIAAYNGFTWLPLGSGLPGGEVRALAAAGNALYAGGQFFVNGGGNFAQWNGSSWTAVGGGADGPVRALTPYLGGVVVGGLFNTTGGVFSPRAVFWSGTQWVALGSGPASPVTALAIYQNHIIAGQFSSISEFNGSTWQQMGNGLSGEVDALTMYNGDLIATGTFVTSGPTFLNRIGRWNGSAWSPLGGGLIGLPTGLTQFRNELIAVGGAVNTGGPPYWARWAESSAPWIAVHPTPPAQQPCPGSNVTLSTAAATGYGSLTYQWRRNSTPLAEGPSGFGSTFSGTLTPSLTISGIAPADTGSYDCIITNACASAASDAISLGVCTANCDCSSASPMLNVNDFTCFLNRFASGDLYANCDASTIPPVLNVNDFSCFLNRFSVGCN